MKKRHGWLVAWVVVMGIAVGISYRISHRTPPAAVAAPNMIPVRTTECFPTTRLDEVIAEVDEIHLIDQKGHSASPKTGAEYLRYHEAGYSSENNGSYKRESWFVRKTLPVSLIRKMKPSQVSFLTGVDFTHNPLDWLPPDFGLDLNGSETDRANKAGKPFHFLWPKATWKVLEDGNVLNIDDAEDGDIDIELLARGDFDGDGIEDMMLFVAKSIQTGTWVEYEIAIITRLEAGGRIKIIHVEG